MKIAPKTAPTFLARPNQPYRGALLYGPDNGLIRERAKQLLSVLSGANPNPFAVAELPEALLLADGALLADELSAISLLCAQRVVVLSASGDKLSKTIEGALPFLHTGVFLLVTADELSARSGLRLLFEKEPALAALACYKDEPRDVQALIRSRFEQAGINAGADIIDYISRQLGNDRAVTHRELEKIVLYAGESRHITLEQAQALIDDNRDTGSDDFINAVANRNLPLLEQLLATLLKEGTQPIVYLRALQRYFNRLYSIKARMETGQSAEQIIGSLRPPVFFKQQPILQRHAQEWSSAQIVKALKAFTSAELACKTTDLPAIAASSRQLFQVTQLR